MNLQKCSALEIGFVLNFKGSVKIHIPLRDSFMYVFTPLANSRDVGKQT